jgi:hypothetical protein
MFSRVLQRWRYGEPVVVVSGLPRSGTSMFMSMLQAGGLPLLTDAVRAADHDNPKGYFEMERVKNLERDADKSWLREARGRGIKVISHLLKELPDDNFYRIVFAMRDVEEVIASQNAMLSRRGEPNPVTDDRARELYRRHLVNVRVMARQRRNMQMIEVHYADAVSDPRKVAERLNAFLGGGLDVAGMAAVVDGNLYRNRTETLDSVSG